MMADTFERLLDAIVHGYVITDAQKDVDLNADADLTAAAIEADKRKAAENATALAGTLGNAFRQGLILAYEAQGTGHSEIRLDDRDPEQNAIADALITFLVRYDLAESRSEETEPGHYEYFISVTWNALYDVANRTGIDLPAALAQSATIPGG